MKSFRRLRWANDDDPDDHFVRSMGLSEPESRHLYSRVRSVSHQVYPAMEPPDIRKG